MLHPREAATLKATVDCWGEVWAAEGRKLPSATGLGAVAFAKSRAVSDYSTVKLDGHEDNVELINELYCLKADTGHPLSIELCSPKVWSEGPRINPSQAILRMMTLYDAPSLGGFVQLEPKVFASYGLAHVFSKGDEYTPFAEWLTYRHPAWAGASFVNAIEPVNFARVVASILDPRWYVDRDRPYSLSKLSLRMGLTERIHRDVEIGRYSTRRHTNFRNLSQCWRSGSAPVVETPRDFLWRFKREKAGQNSELIVNKKFLSFLRWVWLDSLASPNFQGKIFNPSLFFDRQEDAEAYTQHLKAHKAATGG